MIAPRKVHGLFGIVDAHPGTGGDGKGEKVFWWGYQVNVLQPVADEKGVPQQGTSVLCPGEGQGLAQFSRPVQKVLPLVGGELVHALPIPVPGQLFLVSPGLAAADQHGAGFLFGFGHKVQAVVHTIDEVDICRPWRGEEGFCPGGSAVVVGVAGLVDPTDVSFRLCDSYDQRPSILHPHQIASQEVLGHLAGISVVKGTVAFHRAPPSFHRIASGGGSNPHTEACQPSPQ